jgi:dihydrodipicolinate synthase/N-acetylneuraminate lyase
VAALIADHGEKVRGIKVSLLDAALEIHLREMIAATPARVYTGDDFNYVDMIAGDGSSHSDALLGAFAVIPRFASAAFARLDHGDPAGFREILQPTQALSRLVFAAPTQYYKVGVAWLAYLDGRQRHFRMIGGFETGRDLLHLADLIRAAGQIGYFADPSFTANRAAMYFAAHDIG